MPKEFRKDLMNMSFPLKDAEGKTVGTCEKDEKGSINVYYG